MDDIPAIECFTANSTDSDSQESFITLTW